MRAISLAKFEEGITNEDAVIARKEVIAVSDGAGGGGVFAERWSQYLVECLPDDPVSSYEVFDKWIDGIWEPFYNKCETLAESIGGMFQNKFYDEGSFATLVAIWEDGRWISYGDSVAFCYHQETGIMEHSFTKLVNFNNPPYLINCKDPLDSKGFKCGNFNVDDDCVVFAASDTLAHYIIMMYEVAHKDCYDSEIKEALDAKSRNSNYIKTALAMGRIDFEKAVIGKLISCIKNKENFKRHIEGLRRKGLIGHDDYSIAMNTRLSDCERYTFHKNPLIR